MLCVEESILYVERTIFFAVEIKYLAKKSLFTKAELIIADFFLTLQRRGVRACLLLLRGGRRRLLGRHRLS